MYKIALYGNSKKVVELYEAIKKEQDMEVLSVVNPGKTAAVRKSPIPAWLIKDGLDDLAEVRNVLFAVINCDDDPALQDALKAKGFDDVRTISGSSAGFIYETSAAAGVKKDEYKRIIQELKNLSDSLNVLFDKERLLNDILRGLCEQTKAERASIMLYDRKEKVLKVSMAYGIDRVLWDFIKTPIGEGIAGKVVESRQPVLISGSPDDKVYRKIRKREDIKSAICVPMIIFDQVLGVINLASLTNINAFSQKDIEFVTEVSDVLRTILFTTKNFDEYKEDAQRYQILAELSEIISARIPLYDRLKKIVDYLETKYNVIAAISVSGEDGAVEILATNYPLWDQPDIYLEKSMEKWVQENMTELSFLDRGSEGFKGYMSMPLLDGNVCYGTISLLNFSAPIAEKPEFFRELAGQLSTLLALSYRNEKIIEDGRRKSAVEDLVNELGLIDDMQALGVHILKSLAREFAAGISVLRVYDDEKKSYIVKEVTGLENILKKEFFQLDRDIVKGVLKKQAPVLVKNTLRNDDHAHISHIIQNFLVCPLKTDDRVQMVFSFYNCKVRSRSENLTKADVNFVNALFREAEGVIKKLSETRVSAEEELIDGLTGLPNFRYFERRVFEEVTRARRHGQRIVILVAELQPYEKFLKAYGKKRTDDIIQKIAFQIREKIRTFEVVARLNTSKFGVILVDADEKTLEVIFRLKNVFEKQNWDTKGLIREGVHIRFGYSRFPDDGEEYDELIVKANHIRG